MAKTFMQMAAEAQAKVSAISPAEAQRRIQKDRAVLLIDVRDPKANPTKPEKAKAEKNGRLIKQIKKLPNQKGVNEDLK
jgi:hypothetical protein